MRKYLLLLALFLPVPVQASGLQASFTGSNLSLARSTTRCEYDGTVDPSSGNLVDKVYARNLAPSNSPTSVTSTLQNSSGRQYIARNFVAASSQTYSLAHQDWMSMFTSAFTLTMILAPSASGAGTDDLFDKLSGNDGVWMAINASNQVRIRLYNGTDYTEVTNTAVTVRDGYYHVVQIVRLGNLVTIYVDGIPSTITTVRTADGSNNAGALYLWGAGGAYYDGAGLYFRLDAEALSVDRLNYERNQLLGIGPRSGTADIGYTFTRTTISSQSHSDGTISTVAANMPKIGGDGGGVLVEEQRTNIAKYSTTFTVDWAATRASLAATSVVLPDGSTGTSNTFHEGPAADGSTTHYLSYGGTCSMTTVPHTLSLYMKKANRSWVNVRFDDTDSAMGNVFFNLDVGIVGTITGAGVTANIYPMANGWYRGIITATPSSAGNCSILIFAASDGATTTFVAADQDSTYIWGAQVELGAHPTSFITTTSASVTRTQDSLTIRPYKIGKDMLLGGEKMWFDFTQDPAGHTNLILQSQTYGTTWAPIRATITENTALAIAPDGSQTADILVEDSTAGATHYVGQSVATVSGTTYTFSATLKAASRSWARISANTDAAEANFNISTGEIGTITGATAYIKNLGNGWYRCSVTWASVTTASQSFRIYALNSNSSSTFDGVNGQSATYLWGSQLEASSTMTGYVATTTTSRTAVSSNEGLFAWDKGGTTTRTSEYFRGDYYHIFNATDSRYNFSDINNWAPDDKDFSIVLIATPLAVPTAGNFMYVFNKWKSTTNERSWAIYYNDGPDWSFSLSQDGTSGTASYAAKSASVVLGRPQLIIATFDYIADGQNNTMKLYVDDLTVDTETPAYGPPFRSGTDVLVNIGRSSAAGSYFNGYIHYVAFYEDKVISATEATALYSKFKQANILPVIIAHDKQGNKLNISFDAKCAFASATDIGQTRDLVGISGNAGSALGNIGVSTRNMVSIKVLSNGRFIVYVNDDESANTVFDAYSAVRTDYNKWHTYSTTLNFSDFSLSTLLIDGVNAINGSDSWSGTTHQLRLAGTTIRVGVDYAGTANSNCAIRNFRMWPTQ